jgi:hypothetical protein
MLIRGCTACVGHLLDIQNLRLTLVQRRGAYNGTELRKVFWMARLQVGSNLRVLYKPADVHGCDDQLQHVGSEDLLDGFEVSLDCLHLVLHALHLLGPRTC